MLLWTAVISLAIYFVLARSGVLVKLREWLEARGLGPWRVSAAVLAAALVAETVLALPWSVYVDWARERSYGLSSQSFSGWLGESLLASVISLPVTVILFMGAVAGVIFGTGGRPRRLSNDEVLAKENESAEQRRREASRAVLDATRDSMGEGA